MDYYGNNLLTFWGLKVLWCGCLLAANEGVLVS